MTTAPHQPPPRLRLVGDGLDPAELPSPVAAPAHPSIDGTFRSPEGRCGRLTGSLRMERLLITPHGTFVCGVVTGHLRTPDGAVVAVASTPVTAAADLVHEDGRTAAHVHAFDIEMIGIPVRVTGFVLEPTLAVAVDGPGTSRTGSSTAPGGDRR